MGFLNFGKRTIKTKKLCRYINGEQERRSKGSATNLSAWSKERDPNSAENADIFEAKKKFDLVPRDRRGVEWECLKNESPVDIR